MDFWVIDLIFNYGIRISSSFCLVLPFDRPFEVITHTASFVEDGEDDIVAEGASVVHGEPPQDDDGPPKVDSQVEVLHEKVTKQVIKEGHGQKPSKYSTCFCESADKLSFSGFIVFSDIEFISTKVRCIKVYH